MINEELHTNHKSLEEMVLYKACRVIISDTTLRTKPDSGIYSFPPVNVRFDTIGI